MKILLADDEPIARTMLEHWLTGWAYDVVSAKDGRAALEVLQTGSDVRLAVLDWVMPGLDGVDICRQLRQGRQTPYVYVILLTARDDKHDIARGLEAGADDYLIKPCNPFELRVRLGIGKRVIDLQDQLLRTRREAESRALYDGLTGALAKSPVLELLEREIARSERTNAPVAVIDIHIDQFERLCAERGADVADRATQEVARRFGNSIRKYDLLARTAAGEFLVVLPETDADRSLQVAQRLREALSGTPVNVGSGAFRMTACYGLASSVQRPGARMGQLLGAAGQALRVAQQQGRDCTQVARLQDWHESEIAAVVSSVPAA
ncbi:MAG TPA: diguanylate cyclase [Polyangiaceae bacterium]|nr:diguanylate cyclase [Polyangiaceae bacterium]